MFLDTARSSHIVHGNSSCQSLRRHSLLVFPPLPPKFRETLPPRRLAVLAPRQMTQQQSLVIGSLPNQVIDPGLLGGSRCVAVSLIIATVEQHGLDGECRPLAFDLPYQLRRARNEGRGIACSGLQELHMKMDVNVTEFLDNPCEKCAVADLALPLASQEYGTTLRYAGLAAPHPILGTAP